MATESSPTEVPSLTSPEAVMLHIMLMRRLGETHCGVFARPLVASALARPRHAATRCFGLIKHHPGLGGNTRTAPILVDRFLPLHGMELRTTVNATVELALAVAADRWDVDAIMAGYRQRTFPLSPHRAQEGGTRFPTSEGTPQYAA